ncbi:unnamed protein product [Microthlaspi erraticum]|uniref:Neprosin PEP catalytic domain-containing protein n=1 Tax=Microthlaspi erraticum TaxID=1685480 RepID=A0A6D2KRG7_9BRAS|nr:unnamed protein product [Microthlaspi erraticum]
MDFSGMLLRFIILLSLVRGCLTIEADKGILASDGDVVDCTDVKKQLAFDNPLLKNHKFQELPSQLPTFIRSTKRSKWQTLEAHISVAKCPKGTIPARRYSSTSNQTASVSASSDSVHEHAVGIAKVAPKMYGAKATFSVWKPTVEKADELSISQIWITSGKYTTNDVNSIEVGWQSDTYNATGCYNLQCSGFIQTSSSIVIGGTITPLSAVDGNQYEITVSVWRDQKHGNWWLSLGSDHTLVGYWPAELFASLSHAEEVQWRGH